MSQLKHDKWVGDTYGNSLMHRWLIKTLKVLDVRLLYVFAFVFVVPITIIINKKARTAIYKYFRHRLKYSIAKSCRLTFINHCKFAQVVIDRFAMYAGKKFNISINGSELFDKLSHDTSGFIQLSSHIGNYELAGYSLVIKNKRFNALVFADEKESIMANRNKLFDAHNIRMIAMKSDMSHLFAINAALANGEILSMPADRIFGSQKSFTIDFLQKPAKFPQGPFILAAMRDLPVLFVAVMKSGCTSYRITAKLLSINNGTNIRQKATALAHEYVNELENIIKAYPTQWYNYFDFWAE